MNTPLPFDQWIAELGGSLTTESHCEFPGDALPQSAQLPDNWIAPLSHYGFLRIAGPDALRFLQGQATSDFIKARPDAGFAGCFCTAKGRAYSSFQALVPGPDQAILRMRRSIIDLTGERLAKYLVFSKAEQADISAELVAVGLSGPAAADNVRRLFGDIPAAVNHIISHSAGTVRRADEAGKLFECWLNFDQLAAHWPTLSAGMTLQGSRSWALQAIRQGIAELDAAGADEFVPQMLDYHTIGAISFTKGCYTGQEVVARMQYKGTLKRQLYPIRVAGAGLAPATALYSGASGQSIGAIVNAVSTGANEIEALAVIAIKEVEAGAEIHTDNGLPIEVLSRPYAITN